MFNPLALRVDNHVEISLDNKFDRVNFRCKDIENFYDFEHLNRARYLLDNSDNFIETYKDSDKNFHIYYYSLIEKFDFDFSFFSLLGTTTLSYKHPKYNRYITYQKKIHTNEKYETIKVLVESSNEVLNHLNGYFQDANKNWYYLINRYAGLIKKSINYQNKLFWEYSSDKDKILIEIEASKIVEKSPIYVYEKIKLKRKDIKILDPSDATSIEINYF